MKKIKIFDTTLRDGEQAPGCSMQINEKIEIALALEALGVDVIEAGFAVISNGDFEAVKAIASRVKNSAVTSLARAVKKDIEVAARAVSLSERPRIHLFLATSPLHMKYKLKMSEDEVLATIKESVAYAKSLMPDIEFSAEDATRSDRAFLVKALNAAAAAGATTLNIPDTVGYTTPSEMFDLVKYVRENVVGIEGVDLSVHCHNDLGMAVANSLAAVTAGATQIEGTVNGIGERAGNAALEEVIMALSTRKTFYDAETGADTTKISRASKLVYSTIGMRAPLNKAIVGQNAFSHEAGIHQHGVLANRETYEIMTQESIGLKKGNMVFGKHSGKHAIEARLKELGYALTKDELEDFFVKFKTLADKKKTINDTDMEALLGHAAGELSQNGYKLDRFTVNTGSYVTTSAVVRLTHDGVLHEEVAIGDGPIDAAYKAIDKIMGVPEHTLDDYTITSVSDGGDALGEVAVRIECEGRNVTGKGLSTDVIEASLLAYLNGMNLLLKQ